MSEQPTTSPLDTEALRSRVQKHLDSFLAAQVPVLAEVSPDLTPLADALVDLLRGGKRLRPAFAYWGWRGAGGPAKDQAASSSRRPKVGARPCRSVMACLIWRKARRT